MADHAQPRPRRQRRVSGGSPQRINLRTTTTTYAELYARARLCRLSLPRYLVESGLRDPVGWSLRQQRWWAGRLDVVETRLIRVGVNFNQIAARLNATGEPDAGLSGALEYLAATLAWHREILEAIDPADRDRRPRP